MVSANRFVPCETQRHTELQPDCPVLVYCSKRCVEARSGTVFVRVRLVNRTDREIGTVCLQIEGCRADGSTAFTIGGLILADCGARPHSIFGEDRMLALGRIKAELLRVRISHVVFTDGTAWHDLPELPMTTAEEAHWQRCTCGMINPSNAVLCALCGSALPDDAASQATPETSAVTALSEQTEPDAPASEMESVPIPDQTPAPQVLAPQQYSVSAPVVREYYPVPIPCAEEEEPEAPMWLIILLSVLGAMALAAVIGFFIYCLVYFM